MLFYILVACIFSAVVGAILTSKVKNRLAKKEVGIPAHLKDFLKPGDMFQITRVIDTEGGWPHVWVKNETALGGFRNVWLLSVSNKNLKPGNWQYIVSKDLATGQILESIQYVHDRLFIKDTIVQPTTYESGLLEFSRESEDVSLGSVLDEMTPPQPRI